MISDNDAEVDDDDCMMNKLDNQLNNTFSLSQHHMIQ